MRGRQPGRTQALHKIDFTSEMTAAVATNVTDPLYSGPVRESCILRFVAI